MMASNLIRSAARWERRRRCISRNCCGLVHDDAVALNCESQMTSVKESNRPLFPSLLTCGAIGIASGVSMMGYYKSSHAHHVSKRRDPIRFYSSSAARCESNSKPPSSNDNKSDSFFDMAQQWALENLPKSGDTQVTNTNDSESDNNSTETKIFNGPEQFLKAIGAFETQTNKEITDTDPTIPPDVTFNVKDSLQKYMNKFQSSLKPQDKDTNSQDTNSQDSSMSDFISFFFTSNKQSSSDMNELIRQAHNIVNPVSTSGILDEILYMKQNKDLLQKAFESSFAQTLSGYGLSISSLFDMNMATLHYYLEHVDSIKTPSWKRRVHRFYSNVEVDKVEELNEALMLSELSYADGVEEVREGLERLCNYNEEETKNSSIAQRLKRDKPQWELLFCNVESRPGEPSHFLAVQKNTSRYDDTLHVLLVVRGTKSMSDLITDALLEPTDYEYTINNKVLRGKAHSGMVKSGQYLVKRHEKLLSTLVGLSNKQKIEINFIGHSLGAGAATIAAMEWNSKGFNNSDKENNKDIKVSAHVIGFGCPSLLSKPLSTTTQDYVTTVIADADMIPRTSGATIVNLILDLITFDYRKEAERDVEQALRELQSRFAVDDDAVQKVMGYVRQGMDKMVANGDNEEGNSSTEKKKSDFQKLEPVLFPPGTCIHFFRDGCGITGTYTPCTFYNEIDVARTMVEDHLISSGYRRIFLSMMRDFHKDDHFSFESSKTKK